MRKSLSQVIQGISQYTENTIKRLSDQEQKRWKTWKFNNIKWISKLKVRSPRIEHSIRKGIRDLKDLDSVVKQADKNMGLVAIRGDIYNGHTKEWLKPPAFIEVKTFPVLDIIHRLNNICLFNESLRSNYLVHNAIGYANAHDEPNVFYTIPKIHKNIFGTRPITAAHSYCLSKIASLVAEFLQRRVNEHRELAKDSRHVVRELEELSIHGDCVFVTYDVEKCYPNMDTQHAIKVIENNMGISEYERGWINLLKLVNYNNYVTYKDKIYRQMVGTATGSQVAPPFCNLYLYFLFQRILDRSCTLYNSRFIDDGFLILRSRREAEQVLKELNNISNLNLTWKIDNESAIYLDLVIYKGPRFSSKNRLDITAYFKPTNKLLYLPYSSSHPQHMKDGIIKGESIRLLRNNCHKHKWIEQCMYVFKGLMARGYPPRRIKKLWRSIRFEDRNKYVWEESIQKPPTGKFIVTTYHPLTPIYWKYLKVLHPFEDIFKKNKHGEYGTYQCRLIQRWPPRLVYGYFDKIGKHIVSARQSWSYKNPTKKRNILSVQNENRKKPRLSIQTE